MNSLIQASELAASLERPDVRVFDCRHSLQDTGLGQRLYDEGHIPGARFLHLDEDLSGAMNGRNGRHPLPDPQKLADRLGACGVGPETTVVAYDADSGMFAARLWWLLRWLGHERVVVLDGGLAAWKSAGLAIVTDSPPDAAPATLPVRLTDSLLVRVDEVESRLGNPDVQLLDARAPDRFAGQNETLDPVGGHIPGAANRFFMQNLENGRFKSSTQLRTEFDALLNDRPANQIVNSCGSGVTACHNLLAMEVAGLTGSRLYAGSWSEWCSDPARPVER